MHAKRRRDWAQCDRCLEKLAIEVLTALVNETPQSMPGSGCLRHHADASIRETSEPPYQRGIAN